MTSGWWLVLELYWFIVYPLRITDPEFVRSDIRKGIVTIPWQTYHILLTECRFTLLRKSKDYVYGIWVYKVLGIWKGYYSVITSLVSCMKPWTEARNNKYMKYHSKLTYQLSFWNVSRKMDYHGGGKWFIHGPKTPQGESVAKPETPLLIILSIACKWSPW